MKVYQIGKPSSNASRPMKLILDNPAKLIPGKKKTLPTDCSFSIEYDKTFWQREYLKSLKLNLKRKRNSILIWLSNTSMIIWKYLRIQKTDHWVSTNLLLWLHGRGLRIRLDSDIVLMNASTRDYYLIALTALSVH